MFDEEKLNGDLPIIPLIAVLHSTNNFSEESKLGEGGFGPVYKVLMIFMTDSFYIWHFSMYSHLLKLFSGNSTRWKANCSEKALKIFWSGLTGVQE